MPFGATGKVNLVADYQIFNSGVLGALKTNHFVSTVENDQACDAALISVSEWAEKRGIDLAKAWVADKYGGSEVAALMDYSEWLPTWAGLPKIITLTTVSMTLTFTLTTGATLGMSATGIVNDEKLVARGYTELYDAIILGYDNFRQSRKVQATGQPNTANQAGYRDTPPSSEVVDVKAITVEEKNGKRYYKANGGRWLKFGVSIWPEVMQAAGLDYQRLEIGENQLSGYQMDIALENDKPKKVTRLIGKH